MLPCRHDGMADVTDSKSVGSNTVRVQVPLPAPKKQTALHGRSVFLTSSTSRKSAFLRKQKQAGDVFASAKTRKKCQRHFEFNSEAVPLAARQLKGYEALC